MTKVTNTRVGVHDMAKKPNIEDFRKIVRKSGGNLTKVASTFKVARKTIYQWAKEDSDFKDAISDERGSLVDECLVFRATLNVDATLVRFPPDLRTIFLKSSMFGFFAISCTPTRVFVTFVT